MDEDRTELERADKAREPYEPPRMEPLGTMLELTEANEFHALDLSGLSPTSFPSDRDIKENFAAVSPAEVLDGVRRLPIETWNYKTDAPGVRHVGPMAQDFAAVFEVGDDDRSIANVDAVGVCLAAIQALGARVEALETELAELRDVQPV